MLVRVIRACLGCDLSRCLCEGVKIFRRTIVLAVVVEFPDEVDVAGNIAMQWNVSIVLLIALLPGNEGESERENPGDAYPLTGQYKGLEEAHT